MSSAQKIESKKGGRRLPDDLFFDEGDKVCNMYARLGVFDFDCEELCHKQMTNLVCEIPGCGSKLQSVMELELHYNSVHRYSCATCRKSFASAHLLDLHIEETHDSFFAVQAERKPMYRCLIEKCSSKFSSSQERHGHCVDSHAFPPNFRWITPKVSKAKSLKSGLQKETSTVKQGVGVVNRYEHSSTMDVDNPKVKSVKPVRGIVFGRGGVKKSFKSSGPEWHRRVDKAEVLSVLENSELSQDLMDTLPDIP